MSDRWSKERRADIIDILDILDDVPRMAGVDPDLRWKALVYALKTGDPRLAALQAAFTAMNTTWGFDGTSEDRSKAA